MVEIGGRFKKIESAFNIAAARAHLPCDSSSGSDHSPEDTADLLDLVTSFIESDAEIVPENDNPEEELDSSDDKTYEDVKEMLRKLLECHGGGGEERVRIMAVAGRFVAGDIIQDDNSPKRQLMAFLRNKGFDAGLCKSRWEGFGKNTAGKYEYVDVRCDCGKHNRYIVETNLVGEFEIARPTKRYISILSQVPHVFVGTSEELKQLVRIMCHEMRHSMEKVGMLVPPWRRDGYMQAKWFGFYKRTSTTKEMVSSLDYTTPFKGCKEGLWKAKDFKVMVSQLTIAFNASGVEV